MYVLLEGNLVHYEAIKNKAVDTPYLLAQAVFVFAVAAGYKASMPGSENYVSIIYQLCNVSLSLSHVDLTRVPSTFIMYRHLATVVGKLYLPYSA